MTLIINVCNHKFQNVMLLFKFVTSSVKCSFWALRTQYFSAFLISSSSRVPFTLASGPVFFSWFSLDTFLCSFWSPAILHLDINCRTYAVILNNLSQYENFSASKQWKWFLTLKWEIYFRQFLFAFFSALSLTRSTFRGPGFLPLV